MAPVCWTPVTSSARLRRRIVLLSNSDSFSSWDRLSGFCQTLTKSGNDYRILELRDCGGELNRAMRAMVQLLETSRALTS